MKKSISLNSKEWCDIIFKGKNKSYGAYEMRMSSSKRHIAAFLVTLLIAIAAAAIPAIINKVSAATKVKNGGIEVAIVMSDLTDNQAQEEVIEVTPMPEPPKLIINSIQFTPPVIGTDEEVPSDLETTTMADVLADSRVVGFKTVDTGTDDLNLGAELARDEEVARIVEAEKPPLTIAQFMPQFAGGEKEMMEFIGKNLRYPIIDQENGTQGRVTVRFVVTKTGEIDQVEILRGVSPTCDREAMRVVKAMPRWIPGKQNGKPVAVYFTLPVHYKLQR